MAIVIKVVSSKDTASSKAKLIMYELNEVPRKLIDLYIQLKPKSALSDIVTNGFIANTVTTDIGELHPWSTWPTVHRGVDNSSHKIRYINQDLTSVKHYKPIWEILSQNNIDVGVFGSLQSYPPLRGENITYYLPDTFSPDSDSHPKEFEDFQSMNLNLSKENKAISRAIKTKDAYKFIQLIMKGYLSKSSAFKTASHLIKEQMNSKYKARRSIMQGVLTFDLFEKAVYKYEPSFTTYFTNHVAGMMHRYWRDLFPSDFQLEIDQIDNFHSASIIKAMDVADNHMKSLIKMSKSIGYNLLIVSSMGQGSIDRGENIAELFLQDLKKLLLKLDLDPSNYDLLPAMQPDLCISNVDQESLSKIRERIKHLKDMGGKTILKERYEPEGLNINLSIRRTEKTNQTKKLTYKNKTFNIKDAGFELMKRDSGTGYHIPDGILITYGPDSGKFFNKIPQPINTCQICPNILKLYNLPIPNYMNHKA